MKFNEVSTSYWREILRNYERTYGISSHYFYIMTKAGHIVVEDVNIESEWLALHEWVFA